MSRILLVGAGGQVGQELRSHLSPLGEVVNCDRHSLDLTQADAIVQTVAAVCPDLIVNAAAYTAVDKAESEAAIAHAINETAPRILAEQAIAHSISLIHLSTDYVFDGQKNTPYLESDAVNPLGAYGASKLAGEAAVQQVWGVAAPSPQSGCIILRTAWVYGSAGKANFVKTMLRLGAEREEIRVVADQVGSPTWARDLAGAIAGFSVRCLNLASPSLAQLEAQVSPPVWGIYHYTNSGVASWYDFAVAIFEEAQALGFPLKVQRVVPITTADYPTPARRPAYSVLSTQKTTALLGNLPPHWRVSLRQMLTELYRYTYESTGSLGR